MATLTFMTHTIFEVDKIANQGVAAEDLVVTLRVLGRMRSNLKSALTNR